jgi:hypothetical protein
MMLRQANARYNARAVITIENEVLDDPTLIDPNTGLPYGGKMTLPLSTYSESRSIAAGEREQKSLFLSGKRKGRAACGCPASSRLSSR